MGILLPMSEEICFRSARALRSELLIYDNLVAEPKAASKIANRWRNLQNHSMPFSYFCTCKLFAFLARNLDLQHEGSRPFYLLIPRAVENPLMCAF